MRLALMEGQTIAADGTVTMKCGLIHLRSGRI